MSFVIVLLGLIHIFAAVSWFGSSFAGWRFIVPAVQASGEAGWRFTKALYTRTQLGIAFPASAIVTVIAGILLYLTRDPEQNFSQTGQIVLGIGAVIGLVNAGHGIFATGPATQRIVKLLSGVQDNVPLSAETLRQLEAENTKFRLHGGISFAMTTLALLFMATARYL